MWDPAGRGMSASWSHDLDEYKKLQQAREANEARRGGMPGPSSVADWPHVHS